jgi:hypothetical protein
MNNATDNKSSQWPTRSTTAAAELQRAREMPLLFQLADINRVAALAPPSNFATPGTAEKLPPAKPAPIELPVTSSFPIASSTLEPWSPATSSLFDVPKGLSTAALAMGAAAFSEKSAEKVDAKTIPLAAAAEALATEKLPAEKAAVVVSSGLPAAIEAAVKTASAISDAADTKATPNAEIKNDSAKPDAKTQAKAEVKTDAKVATKKEAAPSTPTPAGETIVPKEATHDKPSPASLRRQRAEARQAKVDGQGANKGDWLATHGKVIAICFVIALVGTIYLARRNRGSSAPAPSIDAPNLAVEIPEHKLDAHEHKPSDIANTAPRLVEAPSHPLDATPSPATDVAPSAPDATSTAELQSPVVPNAGQSTTPPSSEPLFPWQNDPRMAARPDDVPAANTPAATPTNSPAPMLNAPTYPETNLRDAPLLPPAPPANNTAPPAAPAPSYPAPASGQGGSSNHVPASFAPASFTSAPGGNRYERTGSGLY